MEGHAECMLVLIGAAPEGRKELVGFQVGVRESAQSWRELLVEVKRRGLAIAPEIAVGDGALGFWKALDEVYPGTRYQRCWLHKAGKMDAAVWHPTVFTHNRDRLLETEVAHAFLSGLLALPQVNRLLLGDHFSVDGTRAGRRATSLPGATSTCGRTACTCRPGWRVTPNACWS